jgi:hypothetical protein
LVKTFWFDGFGNVYDLTFQQNAISAYVGSRISTVMPIGITPVALIIWFPFAYVAQFDMALSYTLWTLFSVGVSTVALWNVGKCVFRKKNQLILPIALSLCTMFSVTTKSAIHQGQTSVLATGLLIYLINFVHNSKNELNTGNSLPICLLILALGMKPPYLALGLGLLIIYGRWRQLFYSITILIIVMIGMTPMLTFKWVSTYINLLRMYSWGNIPEVYAWSITPETMNIFRSAFKEFIGDDVASLISNIVYYLVYINVIGISIFAGILDNQIKLLSRLRVTKGQLYILLIACYLLFSPYAGGHEDVLLISVFVIVLLVGQTPKLTNYKSLGLFLMLFLILIHNSFPHDKPLWLFWIFKAVIFGYMLNFTVRPRFS